MEALIFVAGVFLGISIGILWMMRLRIGKLRIDRSDPSEQPYMFLELDKPIREFTNKSYVLLAVKNENYISHD